MTALVVHHATVPASDISVGIGGTTAYELVSFTPGKTDLDNKIAESSSVDGGVLTSSRRKVLTMNLQVRVTGTSTSDLDTKCNALTALVSQFGYTITDTLYGSITYTCLPASFERAYDQLLRSDFMDYLTFVIPRQP